MQAETAKINAALKNLPGCIYRTATGEEFVAVPLSQVAASLRDAGWRIPSPFYPEDAARAAGLRIARAAYVNGAGRLARQCEVMVLRTV